jgi:hypothetical protein
MAKTLVAAAVVLVSTFALGEEKTAIQPLAPPPAAQLYQIDLVPGSDSGKIISRDLPVLKGTVYVFHSYPTGTLTSVRKSTVKQIGKMSAPAVAAANPTAIKPIGDLAMQGPKSAASGGGPRNMGRARAAVEAANAGTAARTGGN